MRRFFDPGENTTKRTGVTPIRSPFVEPQYAEDDGSVHIPPREVTLYPAPRAPVITPYLSFENPPVPPPPQAPQVVLSGTNVFANPRVTGIEPTLGSITIDDVVYRIVGGTAQPEMDEDYYYATATSGTPKASDFVSRSRSKTFTISPYVGSRHIYIARLASDGDIGGIYFSDAVNNPPINQLGAFTKQQSRLTIGGKMYNIWVSNQSLTLTNSVTVTVQSNPLDNSVGL